MESYINESYLNEKEEAAFKSKLKVNYNYIQTEEEIAQFTLNENLSPEMVALSLLNSSHLCQRQAVLKNITTYLNRPGAVLVILPALYV